MSFVKAVNHFWRRLKGGSVPEDQPFIHFFPIDQRVFIDNEPSVLDVALKGDVPISHSCGKMGSCGTCLIRIVASSQPLSPRTELEQEMAGDRKFADTERLACQLEPCDGLVVEYLVPRFDGPELD